MQEAEETFCGSGASKHFVPDTLLGCTFSIACKEHDECYGKCDPGGELYGSGYCKLSESSIERTASKTQCDIDLKKRIKEINNNTLVCSMFANTYKTAVNLFGQGPFNGNEVPDFYKKVIMSSFSEEDAIYKLQKSEIINLERIEFNDRILSIPTLREIDSIYSRNPRIINIPNDLSARQFNQTSNIRER